jgi:hypothetical protein
MRDLQGPHPDERPPSRALHHPTARRRGQRTLRRWTALGGLAVAGLTAATVGLAYQASTGDNAGRNAQRQHVLAEYQHRQALQASNLAKVRAEQRTIGRRLAREHALLVARRRERQQQLQAIQVAQAAAAAAAARTALYASARVAPSPARTTALERPAAAPRATGDSANAASGGS